MEEKTLRTRDEVFEKAILSYPGKYKTVDEYAGALSVWMQNTYQLQCLAAFFPYYVASTQMQSAQQSSAATSGSSQPTTQTPLLGAGPQAQDTTTREAFAREYKIPSIWRRCAAEALDFILLFAFKLAIVYFATDYLELSFLQQVEDYDLETLSNYLMADYQVALNMTTEILFLEMVHRVTICFVEALCTHRGPGGVGGATPGKHFMGLRVVRCEWSVQMTNSENVSVYPGTDLGFGRALLRAVVKNLSLTFLFPICFTLFSFQHNRTLYDMFSGSIVIESVQPRRRQE